MCVCIVGRWLNEVKDGRNGKRMESVAGSRSLLRESSKNLGFKVELNRHLISDFRSQAGSNIVQPALGRRLPPRSLLSLAYLNRLSQVDEGSMKSSFYQSKEKADDNHASSYGYRLVQIQCRDAGHVSGGDGEQ